MEEARRVAHLIGIPFYVLNLEDDFQHWVIDYMCREYAGGRTPNPCLACNKHLKFDILLNKAVSGFEAQFLATGHYARIEQFDGQFRLKKARDLTKDQSYVLYMLNQAQLACLLFPLGNLTKREVRRIARELKLPVAEKPESQDICFVPNGDYRVFLRSVIPQTIKPGPIFNQEGEKIGQHEGLPFYTVGQRSGLRLNAPTPKYVLSIDYENNALVVGDDEDLFTSELMVSRMNFVSGTVPSGPISCSAQIRYRATELPATLIPQGNGRAQVVLKRPGRAPAPGQAVVFYVGDEVVAGGIIESGVKID